MKCFMTNSDNDWMIDALGNLMVGEGLDAYRQDMVNRIRLQQYEYAYDLGRGINYMGYVFADGGNLKAWEAQVLDLVSGLDYVKSIVKWAFNVNGDNLEFDLVVETDLGEIEVKG